MAQSRQRLAGLGWVGSREDVAASHKHIGTGCLQLSSCLQVHAAIHLDESLAAGAVQQLAQLRHLLQGMWDELLTAEARVDTHQQDEVHIGSNVLQHRDRCGRIERHTSLHACLVNLTYNAVQVRTSLIVHVHQVGSESLDLAHELLGLNYHQMHIERLLADACHML